MIGKIGKLNTDDKNFLREIITNLRLRDKSMKVRQITGTDFYNINQKMFKIIFHYDTLGNVIIDSIRIK